MMPYRRDLKTRLAGDPALIAGIITALEAKGCYVRRLLDDRLGFLMPPLIVFPPHGPPCLLQIHRRGEPTQLSAQSVLARQHGIRSEVACSLDEALTACGLKDNS